MSSGIGKDKLGGGSFAEALGVLIGPDSWAVMGILQTFKTEAKRKIKLGNASNRAVVVLFLFGLSGTTFI
jgi:hypothetical protein